MKKENRGSSSGAMVQPKALNKLEYLTQKELGLNISEKMHNEYGEDYQNKPADEASCYSSFIKLCGTIPQIGCCLLAPFGKGPVVVVPTGYIGLLTEFGRLVEKVPPGLSTINPCSQKITLVDLRVKILDIPPQPLLTKDNVTLDIDAYVEYQIICPELATYKVENYVNLIYLLTQGVLKTIIAERTLNELLMNRDEVDEEITRIIDQKTSQYGISVISIELQEIQLPEAMMRTMATAAESKKEAEAKLIHAKGNLDSAKIFGLAAS